MPSYNSAYTGAQIDAAVADAQTALQPADVGTAAALDVAATGNAASGEVVKGDDTRLSDARTPTAHTHPISQVVDLQTELDALDTAIDGKQATLVSGTNIKTVGGTSILGAGDIPFPSGGSIVSTDISDSTTAGRALLTAADVAAQRTALELGTAALAATGDFATAAQGALADSATQPADLATVATTGAYGDLTGRPTLGTAAAAATGDFATAAQGALADSAVQPGDLAAVATSGSAADLSAGTLPAARMPALTGDVTTTAGAVATSIANGAVTLAKMANLAASTIIGRVTGSTGVPEALTAANVRTITETETTSQLNTRDTNNRARANHTGTQLASTISDFNTAADARITASNKVSSDTTGITGADQITNMVSLTQAEFDAIGSPDGNTAYFTIG